MSGGSHNYIYYQIQEGLVGQMEDQELNDLMSDMDEVVYKFSVSKNTARQIISQDETMTIYGKEQGGKQ